MPKKYLLWTVIAFILIATMYLLVSKSSKTTIAPDNSVQLTTNESVTEKIPEKIDIANSSSDFEEDAGDLDVSEEILDDFDSDDFDAETIDESAF